jgi:ATP-dependent DNA helicase DinG
MDLSRLGWIDKLASRALRVGQVMEVEELADCPASMPAAPAPAGSGAPGDGASTATLKGPERQLGPARYGLPRHAARALLEPLAQVMHHASGFLDALRAISKALRAEIKDNPRKHSACPPCMRR